jgi:hypothetical protein
MSTMRVDVRKLLAVAFAGFAVHAVAASACSAPPVLTAEHALCFAREYVSASKPPSEVVYEVENHSDSWWVVHYRPANSNVRGGAGSVAVQKSSGNVIPVNVER